MTGIVIDVRPATSFVTRTGLFILTYDQLYTKMRRWLIIPSSSSLSLARSKREKQIKGEKKGLPHSAGDRRQSCSAIQTAGLIAPSSASLFRSPCRQFAAFPPSSSVACSRVHESASWGGQQSRAAALRHDALRHW